MKAFAGACLPETTFLDSLRPKCPCPRRTFRFLQSIPCRWRTNRRPSLGCAAAASDRHFFGPSLFEEPDTYAFKENGTIPEVCGYHNLGDPLKAINSITSHRNR